ncbi:MAG: Ig-like domain-containing protein [Clostridia bacterium]|nr:Ig-like domain-containing protein [Clostridia bacterium]
MVKGFKKVLSLAFALLFAFGAMPIAGVVAFAEGAAINFDTITVSPASVNLDVGETKQLAASGAYLDKDGKPVANPITDGIAWSSADTSVVSVSNTGLITAEALPEEVDSKTVVVSAYYTNPNGTAIVATCEVTVERADVLITSIKWDLKGEDGKALTTLIEGDTYSFKDMYKILPSKATNKTVEVTCEPENALEIDIKEQKFIVNDKIDDGIVRLTIKTKDGSKLSNTVTLQVYDADDLRIKSVRWTWAGRETTGICKLDYYKNIVTKEVANYYYEKEEDGEIVRKYKLSPEYAIAANAVKIEFRSSDKRVAYFDETTKRLVPKGNGYTEITIIVTNDKNEVYTDKMGIVVAGAPYTPAVGVEMTSKDDDGGFTFVKKITKYYTETVQFGYNLKASDYKLSADVAPNLFDKKGELLPHCNVRWYSTNEKVVVIDEKTGLATCKDSGSAEIVLEIEDNGMTYEARCEFVGKIRWWQWLIRLIFGWIANIF